MKAMALIGSSLLLILVIAGCSAMGNGPDKIMVKSFEKSKNFNVQKSSFKNRRQGIIDEMQKNFKVKDIFTAFSAMKKARPKTDLPEMKPDLNEFLLPSDELKVIWFGHSTFLLNMDGKIVLVDPIFSDYAAPVNLMVKRFQAPVLKLEELPTVDYVLISHDHYDHLDMKTIKFFQDKKTEFITPLGVGAYINEWGIPANRITQKDWWESINFGDVEFIATPSQHFSGRGIFDRNKTLWASWVIRSKNHNVYFSGDSGYDVHFKDIGDKYGPFDLAFMESGQYNEKWKEVHMLPEEAVKAYNDLKAKKYFPIHWGMFSLAFHQWYEPAEKLSLLSKEYDVDLVTPKIGELYSLNENNVTEQWWKEFI